jgi:hypothetical protein
MKRKLYQVIALKLHAMGNCTAHGNKEWYARHHNDILGLIERHLPSGGGVDNGSTLDLNKSTPSKLVFATAFHHMDDHGSYDGWTDHTVIVTADLGLGFDLKVTGRNRSDIKDYLGEIFSAALDTEIDERTYSDWPHQPPQQQGVTT